MKPKPGLERSQNFEQILGTLNERDEGEHRVMHFQTNEYKRKVDDS